MKRALQLVILFALAVSPVAGQVLRGAPKGGVPKGMPKGPKKGSLPKGAGPNAQVERLLEMSPEQRERALEKLPPQQQANFRKRFEQFDKLPPEERARRIEMW